MCTSRQSRSVTVGLSMVTVLTVSWCVTESAIGANKGANMKVAAKVESPAVIAVRVRHDMCPFCKSFDPKFPELTLQSKNDRVLFVTLDLTNETTQRQAAMLVGALGLEKIWTGDMSRMGSIILVDGKTKEEISTVMQTDPKTVAQALRQAIASRS